MNADQLLGEIHEGIKALHKRMERLTAAVERQNGRIQSLELTRAWVAGAAALIAGIAVVVWEFVT